MKAVPAISLLMYFHSCTSRAATARILPSCEFQDVDGTCFGHELKQKYFLLGDEFINLNHGSFGTVPQPVSKIQQKYFFEQESHPDTWFRVSYFNYIDAARFALSNLVHALADDLVLVENASAAVNSILRTLALKKGDKVLRLSTAYGMVTNTLAWLESTIGIEVIIVEVAFPALNSAQILQAVSSTLEQNPDVKLCIFSHISSIPAMIEPVKELSLLAHKVGSLVIIDGAHAPGVLDINITDINPDFYLGNCHKWLFAPKGTAFLWVAKSQQLSDSPEPTVISSSGDFTFTGRYKYTGTRDYTGFSSLPSALQFIETLGGLQQIQRYNHNLAVTAANLLVKAWGTSLLVKQNSIMPAFFLVVLVCSFCSSNLCRFLNEFPKCIIV